jgi:hypothetical protein
MPASRMQTGPAAKITANPKPPPPLLTKGSHPDPCNFFRNPTTNSTREVRERKKAETRTPADLEESKEPRT